MFGSSIWINKTVANANRNERAIQEKRWGTRFKIKDFCFRFCLSTFVYRCELIYPTNTKNDVRHQTEQLTLLYWLLNNVWRTWPCTYMFDIFSTFTYLVAHIFCVAFLKWIEMNTAKWNWRINLAIKNVYGWYTIWNGLLFYCPQVMRSSGTFEWTK